jgi:hypothetical protein
MREQIEQLKSDKAALEVAQIVMRKHGNDSSLIVDDAAVRIQEKINRLEKQTDDPWKEAKQLIRYWGRDDLILDNNGRLLQQVALYVRHLELKAKELEASNADSA